MGESVSGLKSGSAAYIWIAAGIIIAILGFLGNKTMNIIALILGLAVAGMAIKYKMDAGSLTGIGIWIMLAGGVLAVIGSAMGLTKKAA